MATISTYTLPAENGSTRPLEAQPQKRPAGMKKRSQKDPQADYQKLVDTMLEARKAALWELCSLLEGISPTAESLLHDYLGLDSLCKAVLRAIPLTENGQKMARRSINEVNRKIKKLQSEDSSHV